MQPSRRKNRFLPEFETSERRELLSATPLGAFSTLAKHVTGDSLTDRVGHNDRAQIPNSGHIKIVAVSSIAHSRVLSTSVSSIEQSRLADNYLELANTALRDLRKHAPASESSTLHQAVNQIHRVLGHNPTGAAQVAESNLIDSILSTIGPGDPFASLPVIAESQLQPGDIIARCTPGLVSQGIEIGTWSRYSHVALYIGNGQIIDSTARGVQIRSLADLLASSDRVGVLRVPGLTANEAQVVIQGAESHDGAAYNFAGAGAIGLQKITGVVSQANQGLGAIIGVLSRAEHLPDSVVNNGTYWCSQLVVNALESAGINPTYANGATPGDVVRLGTLGVFEEVGRLPFGTSTTTPISGEWLP
jgi:hypothetical protein